MRCGRECEVLSVSDPNLRFQIQDSRFKIQDSRSELQMPRGKIELQFRLGFRFARTDISALVLEF